MLFKPFKQSLYAAVIGSFLITAVITVWAYIENPGQVFKSDQHSNKTLLIDTALSWFWPLALFIFGVVYVVLLTKYILDAKYSRKE
ncbi:hypothetical protein [Thalassotalea agarivorans]|uniref:Uncharacterized protein n=1 Tax=Thalassotalea agarivorans TaxID=349064 RepID=A0A1I0DFT4_THASX|nr:hypothetical protein [Thalassotalea agarivorans]SET30638.1 hypothetical protein SAMN05660429_01480 [Thalassotalea agarivorans]